MAQQAVEIILMRQLASSLALPVFLVDPKGILLYYNEPAEAILGLRFSESGAMDAQEWATRFQPEDQDGKQIEQEALPLIRALEERQPASREFWITDANGRRHRLNVAAFPLLGVGDRFLGAVAIFTER